MAGIEITALKNGLYSAIWFDESSDGALQRSDRIVHPYLLKLIDFLPSASPKNFLI